MNKSQLRKLAARFADGRIAADEYRAQRRELIDAIVAGDSGIDRDAPVTPVTPVPPVPPVPPSRGQAASARSLPWHWILAGASALCVLVLLWLLWPSKPPPAPEPPPLVLAPEVPHSRTLVESFLALRDFGTEAIAKFEAQWLELSAHERDAARSELWFRSLVSALRDEVKTQRALAALSDEGHAMTRARRVVELAQRLGVAEQLPALRDTVDTVPSAETPAPEAPTTDAASSQLTAEPPPAALPSPTSTAERAPQAMPQAASTSVPTGRQWLAARADDELTLQLFAVNALDRVEQFLSRYPDLDLHILATDGHSPRYRIFHGVYADTDSARTAFSALPADVIAAAGGAIVKSFVAVREDLQGRALHVTPAGTATDTRGDYTLQLFASASRNNAQGLVDAFPGLALELRELSGDAAPYRVVYGRFDNAGSAIAATLPPDLLARIGKPLVKPLGETGASVR